jgi:hypothetical protein
MTVRDAAKHILASNLPIRVVENGLQVGVVGHNDILAVIAGVDS